MTAYVVDASLTPFMDRGGIRATRISIEAADFMVTDLRAIEPLDAMGIGVCDVTPDPLDIQLGQD